MKIYTKKGDDGSTQLFGSSRVPKYDLRVESYGTIDELNAQLGFLLSLTSSATLKQDFTHLQVLLFDIGSHLATDPSNEQAMTHLPKITDDEVQRIEDAIDDMEEELPPLRHFILPSGSSAIAQAHICRTICRRSERRVAELASGYEVHPLIVPILNRLSDYFFVVARFFAHLHGVEEIKWMPREAKD